MLRVGNAYFWKNKVEEACRKGNVEQITAMVQNKRFNINDKDCYGRTLLHLAANIHKLQTVACLIDLGANVHARDNSEQTPLHIICGRYDSPNIVRLLLEAGADINACDDVDRTPLIYAIKAQNESIVDCLIDQGANVNYLSKNKTPTALFVAVKKQSVDIVTTLLEAGADIHLGKCKGRTLLAHACIYPYPKIIKVIIDAGADVNEIDENGDTLLINLIKYDPYAYRHVTMLIDNGADVTIPGSEGCTPIVCLMQNKRSNLSVIPSLVLAGADVYSKNKKGQSLLYVAMKRGYLDVIKMCLAMGFKYENYRDNQGRTLVFKCVSNYDKDLLVTILALGADHTIPTIFSRQTPLEFARWQHRTKEIEILESLPFSLQTLCWVRIRLNEHLEEIMSAKSNKRQRTS